MRYILFFIFSFYLFSLNAEDYYELNSINTVNITKIILPDGSIYST